MKLELPDPEAAQAFARSFAAALQSPLLVFLKGPLGAGKTHFVRALLRALGYAGVVKSPTYTLIERYRSGGFALCHLDLYRIAAPEELEYLDLRESIASEIVLIEWPERGSGFLPAPDLELCLDYSGIGRTLEIHAPSARGQGVLERLAHRLPATESGATAPADRYA